MEYLIFEKAQNLINRIEIAQNMKDLLLNAKLENMIQVIRKDGSTINTVKCIDDNFKNYLIACVEKYLNGLNDEFKKL